MSETRRRYTVASLTEYPCPHCGSSAFATGSSWMEAADVPTLVGQSELARLRAFALLVSDLDRNRNGRHEGDVDSGEPAGVSHGNPSLPTGAWIGTTMSGRKIVVPPRNLRHDPEAWIEPAPGLRQPAPMTTVDEDGKVWRVTSFVEQPAGHVLAVLVPIEDAPSEGEGE